MASLLGLLKTVGTSLLGNLANNIPNMIGQVGE